MNFSFDKQNVKFGVVIVTYNRILLLKECIECVLNQSRKFDRIVIVDNCSTDGTPEYLKKTYDNVKDIFIYEMERNLGGAGGFKQGISKIYRDVDYVLLIDDDAMLDVNFLNNIIMKMHSSIGAYSGVVYTNSIIDTSHRRRIKSSIFMTKKDIENTEYLKDEFDYDLSTFCGLIVSSKIIAKIGLPREEYFIWYDDTEYSMRILEYSKIRNINNAIINHKTILGQGNNKLTWKSFYGYRNAIDLGRRYSKNPLLYILYRYSYHGFRYVYFGVKSIFCLKDRKYLKYCQELHLDVLIASIHKKLGFNFKYNVERKF